MIIPFTVNFYYAIVCCLTQLLCQLKDHVQQTMEDVIKFELMSLQLYNVTVKPDTSVLHSCIQNALVSHIIISGSNQPITIPLNTNIKITSTQLEQVVVLLYNL